MTVPLDEAVARHALARGLLTPAHVDHGRRRQAALAAAGQPCDLLTAMAPTLAPQVLEELRRLAAQALAASRSSAPGVPLAPATPPAGVPGPRPGLGGAPALPGPGEAVGRYQVVRELARGGMGAVYVAAHTELERSVALKVRLPGGDARAAARFLIEAQAAAKLRHPAIVSVHEAGEDALGRQFLVMDLVEGEALDRRVRRAGPLPPGEVAAIGRAIARALAHAHAQGVLHRDLKPANIIIRAADGAALLTDFGLARLGEGAEGLTRTGEVMGTPSFMAPEQASGEKHAVDQRSDVYGLGATLYHLLVGRPPFDGDSVMTVVHAVIKGDLVPPRSLRPEVPPALEAIILRAMAREPEARYPTAEALAQDLERLLEGAETEARRAARAAGRRVAARRGLTAAALAGLVALALAGAAALTRGPAAGRPPPVTDRPPPVTDRPPPATDRPPPTTEPQAARRFDLATLDVVDAPEASGAASSAGGQRPEAMFLAGDVWMPVRGEHVAPAQRWGHALAWDARRRVVVLAGGLAGRGPLGDVWTWDGAAWRQEPGATPPPRHSFGLVWDATRERRVLVGGADAAGEALGDVWEHDGERWTQAAAPGGPGPRWGHALVHDPAGRRVLLFGGVGADRRARADLWAWDGARWAELAPAAPDGPPGAVEAAAWDARRAALVALCARAGAAEHWEWTAGRGWVRARPPAFGAREAPVLVDTPGGLVLFGGLDARGRGLNDTWLHDGAGWTRLEADIPPEWLPMGRAWHAGAWDAQREVVVVFGGALRAAGRAQRLQYMALRDTWELKLKPR